jgi:hypothetical protein
MEYFVGSFTTIVVALLITRVFLKRVPRPRLTVSYSQSRIYSLISPVLKMIPEERKELKTQASDYFDKINYRILIVGSEAYWIKDNSVYVAQIIDGEIDENSTKKVDTMSMNSVQLKKMVFIVDKLTEGKSNDSGNSGN